MAANLEDAKLDLTRRRNVGWRAANLIAEEKKKA